MHCLLVPQNMPVEKKAILLIGTLMLVCNYLLLHTVFIYDILFSISYRSRESIRLLKY